MTGILSPEEMAYEEEMRKIEEEIMASVEVETIEIQGDQTTPPVDLEDDDLDEDSDEFFRKLCKDELDRFRYIVKEEMFFDTISGQKYTAKQFNTVVTRNFPIYRKTVKTVEYGKANRAFLEGTYFKCQKGIRSEINSTKPSGALTDDKDGNLVNTYVKRGCGSRAGNVDMFIKLMDVLFEYEEDKQLMLKIMKWTVEHAGDPDKRLMFAPFITGIEGNGKSTIVGIMSQIIGERYMISPDASTLKGAFSGFLENALLVNINESEEAKNSSLAEKLKPWITEKYLTIQPKGKEAFKVLNTSTFIITTNNPNALMQTSGSTRFCNFDTRFENLDEMYDHFGGREAKDKFYEDLYYWLEKKHGYARINNYLQKKVKYGNFKGNKGRAPYTKSHDSIMNKQKTETMNSLEEAIELLGGIFTLVDLVACLKSIGSKTPNHHERDTVLKNLGYAIDGKGKYFIQTRVSNGYASGAQRRIAYPDSMTSKEAGKKYGELCLERGVEV